MTYDYYLKQPKSLCEIRFNQILAKNQQLIKCPNIQSNHRLIGNYTHRSLIQSSQGCIKLKFIIIIFLVLLLNEYYFFFRTNRKNR